MPARVVANGRLLVAEAGEVLQYLVDVLVRPLGALEGGVGLVHIGLVMLVVMDAHRLLVDVRLERVVVVGKVRYLECHLPSFRGRRPAASNLTIVHRGPP